MRPVLQGAGLALLLICLAGCAMRGAALGPGTVTESGVSTSESLWWWSVRFRLHWPEGAEPPWYPDLFIAERVIGPILLAEGERIPLWRFHRRAARDAAGRQFSLLFRATPQTAGRINARIAADPRLARWQGSGIIETVLYDDPASPQRPGIGDTSDPIWSPEMQRAWPFFIMGVSRLWLELIRELGQADDLPRQSRARYAALSERVDRQWREEGGHALLHHLNALFAYRELEVVRRKVEVMRF